METEVLVRSLYRAFSEMRFDYCDDVCARDLTYVAEAVGDDIVRMSSSLMADYSDRPGWVDRQVERWRNGR